MGHGSVIATTKQTATITENMIRFTFPRAGGEISPLGEKLLGREVMIFGSVHFDWDDASGRVLASCSRPIC